MSIIPLDAPVPVPTFPPDVTIEVRPYRARVDGEDAIIGDELRGVFLTIPVEGLGLLESLSQGLTVGAAAARFEAEHGEAPDLEDFLGELADEGFVVRPGRETTGGPARPGGRVWDLGWLSQRAARRILSAPVLLAGAAVIALAVVLCVLDPGAMPGISALNFPDHVSLYLLTVVLLGWLSVFVHELAHVLGARAAGVTAELRMGNLMFTMVAQTDMSGIWLASKRQRYVALLIGAYVDLVGGSVMLTVLWLERHGVLTLPRPVHIVLAALLITFCFRLVWQGFFFLRTDVYFVLVTALGTPSLMADTNAYLRNITRRLRGRTLIDQSGVRPRETRIIRAFAVVWVLGRLLNLWVLFHFTLPVLSFYLVRIAALVTGREIATGRLTWGDMFLISVIVLFTEGSGLILWAVNSARSVRARRKAPNKVLVE